MSTHPLGRFLLPYCLQRVGEDQWLALNRNYKPLGHFGSEWVNYEGHPSVFKAKITAKQAAKISFCGDEDLERIYLYNDGSNPSDHANWPAYSQRLEALMELKLKT